MSDTVGVFSDETMAAGLRAPFPWFGGKSRAADLIWERFGDVANYVEPFAGALAVQAGAKELSMRELAARIWARRDGQEPQ